MPVKGIINEKTWERAEKIAREQGQAENYALIMSIYKRLGGLVRHRVSKANKTNHMKTINLGNSLQNLKILLKGKIEFPIKHDNIIKERNNLKQLIKAKPIKLPIKLPLKNITTESQLIETGYEYYDEIAYFNQLIKAKRDVSKLTKKVIINKKGHRQTVYVRTTKDIVIEPSKIKITHKDVSKDISKEAAKWIGQIEDRVSKEGRKLPDKEKISLIKEFENNMDKGYHPSIAGRKVLGQFYWEKLPTFGIMPKSMSDIDRGKMFEYDNKYTSLKMQISDLSRGSAPKSITKGRDADKKVKEWNTKRTQKLKEVKIKAKNMREKALILKKQYVTKKDDWKKGATDIINKIKAQDDKIKNLKSDIVKLWAPLIGKSVAEEHRGEDQIKGRINYIKDKKNYGYPSKETLKSEIEKESGQKRISAEKQKQLKVKKEFLANYGKRIETTKKQIEAYHQDEKINKQIKQEKENQSNMFKNVNKLHAKLSETDRKIMVDLVDKIRFGIERPIKKAFEPWHIDLIKVDMRYG